MFLKLTDDEKLLGYRLESYENEECNLDVVVNEKGIPVRKSITYFH